MELNIRHNMAERLQFCSQPLGNHFRCSAEGLVECDFVRRGSARFLFSVP
jgi:hypothetical protein